MRSANDSLAARGASLIRWAGADSAPRHERAFSIGCALATGGPYQHAARRRGSHPSRGRDARFVESHPIDPVVSGLDKLNRPISECYVFVDVLRHGGASKHSVAVDAGLPLDFRDRLPRGSYYRLKG